MSLHGDYAFVENKTLSFGCVHRISLNPQGRKGAIDYTKPVPYNHENKDRLDVILSVYSKVEEQEDSIIFAAPQDTVTVKFTRIISHVNMEFSDGNYKLPQAEYAVLEEECNSITQKSSKPKNAKQAKQTRQRTSQYEDDTGMITTQVEPEDAPSGLRRSKRTRRVRSSLTT